MNKIILIDGNNFLFRSYYATAYRGNMMRNSKGFPTNALYGFINMINKIITDEKPKYILVAFDKGKTFRHESYENYKAGRIEMPEELKLQITRAKDTLDAMGIKYFDIDGYEADDIIGTAAVISKTKGFETLIISSDKDLLQLINEKTVVKLLKSKDFKMVGEKEFFEMYGLSPEKIIDLKGLEGDVSDNIPGVKGVGEKTALKLLKEYGSIENIYANIANIKEALQKKLLDDRDNAFMSKQLATIFKEVPLDFNIKETLYEGPNSKKLKEIFEELEFYSLLKTVKQEKKNINKNIIHINSVEDLKPIQSPCSVYLELENSNYHSGEILGMGVYDGANAYFIPKNILLEKPEFLVKNTLYTYDAKKHVVVLDKYNIPFNNIEFDLMIAAYLLNYNVKEDIAYLANAEGYDVSFYEYISKAKTIDEKQLKENCIKKAIFIYETTSDYKKKMQEEEVIDLFENIEMPLTFVLANMEKEGIKVEKSVLKEMGIEIDERLNELSTIIYELSGEEFNIASPKQLGEILFSKLKLSKGKKNTQGFSTDKNLLYKLKDEHPIINKILEYRTLSKLQNTYVKGLNKFINKNGKIHTIYTQTLTRTGRLSSTFPNLQNIPIRLEYGRLIRKAFIANENSVLLSSDYSQIELRIFAHLSKVSCLIDAFNNNIDIHAKTAMDIFDVELADVTPDMREQAKAVNFGILYGISSFGLAENLDINFGVAKEFIDKYFETYPGVKSYMDGLIKEAHEAGYVKTLLGRKRTIDELKSTNYIIRKQGERMALNTPVQGTSADILKVAMINIDKKIKENKLKSRMLLQVHDELIFNVYDDEVDIMKKIVKDLMQKAYKLDVPLVAQIKTGSNWYDIK